ncbi:MAG: hypothetical protein LBJ00_01605 [Planctomycetaceae bacterium]|nr:hypothetical protein [Planctomycetaceae bacterium]
MKRLLNGEAYRPTGYGMSAAQRDGVGCNLSTLRKVGFVIWGCGREVFNEKKGRRK